jgi:cell division protein FtsB
MRLDELYSQAIHERRDRDEGEPVRYADPELARTLAQASVKYPYYKTGQEGFMKYVQRSLKHSEQNDKQHNQEIQSVRDEIEQLKAAIKKLQNQ